MTSPYQIPFGYITHPGSASVTDPEPGDDEYPPQEDEPEEAA